MLHVKGSPNFQMWRQLKHAREVQIVFRTTSIHTQKDPKRIGKEHRKEKKGAYIEKSKRKKEKLYDYYLYFLFGDIISSTLKKAPLEQGKNIEMKNGSHIETKKKVEKKEKLHDYLFIFGMVTSCHSHSRRSKGIRKEHRKEN